MPETMDCPRRLVSYGTNELPLPRQRGFWRLFLRRFASPLIYVLLAGRPRVRRPRGLIHIKKPAALPEIIVAPE